MGPPQRRKSIISQQEKIARMKEARQKYSQRGGKFGNSSTMANGARTSIAPTTSLRPPTAPRQSIAPKVSKKQVSNNDDDFVVDERSLEMIKNCKVTLPVNRPSISSRNTLGTRPSFASRVPARSRASMAPEPRMSLLPLGINIFAANASQRSEVTDYLNSITESTKKTPGKVSSVSVSSTSTSNVFNNTLNSTRHRTIRFMESTIQEVRESAESAEVAEVAASVRHSPISDTSFMPTSILSTRKKERKKVNLDAPAPRTPRKLNFDDEDTVENSKVAEEIENNGGHVVEFRKIVNNLITLKLSPSEMKEVQCEIEKLQKALNVPQRENEHKTPLKRPLTIAPVPMTPLGQIMENLAVNEEDEEEEEEVDEEEKAFLAKIKKRRRSSRMKADRRSINRRVSRGSLKRD